MAESGNIDQMRQFFLGKIAACIEIDAAVDKASDGEADSEVRCAFGAVDDIVFSVREAAEVSANALGRRE